jgi:hypothetical protein
MPRLTKKAWFGPNPTGGMPMAASWEGWFALLVWLAAIAATVRISDGGWAWVARLGASAAFFGLAYLTYDSDAFGPRA